MTEINTMYANPEAPPPAENRLPCDVPLLRILIGITLTALTINAMGLGYLLPAIGIVLQLLGFRALRRESRCFLGCYVLIALRAVLFFASLLLNTTIYHDLLTAGPVSTMLTVSVPVLQLAELVLLRSGLIALRRRSGLSETAGGATALFVWYLAVCALGLLQLGSIWLIFIPVLIAYILILRSLFRSAAELSQAGCTVSAAPIKVSDGQLTAGILVLLLIGGICGYRFGGQYPMDWSPYTPDTQAQTQEITAQLAALGFPSDVLSDMTADDIAACADARKVVSTTTDRPITLRRSSTAADDNAKELRLTHVGVQLDNDRWIVVHHFRWLSDMKFYGTESIQLWPTYNNDSDHWSADGDPSGRLLCEKDGQTLTADYYSLDSKQKNVVSFFGGTQSGVDIFAAFSMPRGSSDQRGYVMYGTQTPTEDGLLNSWMNYTHQISWSQFPVMTAAEQRATGWSSDIFCTAQTALQVTTKVGGVIG